MTLSLIHKAVQAEKKMEENFEVDGKIYLVRCQKCGKENCAMAVSSGICAWCGYNANKEGDSGD